MERETIVLEFMKSIAPVLVQEGSNLQRKLIDLGSNPEKCTCGGLDILHAYSKSAKDWAEALADEFMNPSQLSTEQGD